jgi:hypothetical protein
MTQLLPIVVLVLLGTLFVSALATRDSPTDLRTVELTARHAEH